MIHNEKIIPFGDLSHLTRAATCPKKIQIGADLCDIWARPLNQNTDVVRIFHWLHLTNTSFIGFASTLTFFFFTIKFSRLQGKIDLPLFLGYCSPVVVLAIDRGNEIITIILIFIAILSTRKISNFSKCSDLILFIAGIFKFWPFLLLISLWIFNPKSKLRALFALLSAVYILIKIDSIVQIRNYTQSGSILGNSFGLGIFDFSQFYDLVIFCSGLILGIFLIRSLRLRQLTDEISDYNSPYLFPILATFIFLWLSGGHFAYRLVLLLPLIPILHNLRFSKRLRVYLAITLLTARLSISPIVTTSLLVVFGTMIYFHFSSILRNGRFPVELNFFRIRRTSNDRE